MRFAGDQAGRAAEFRDVRRLSSTNRRTRTIRTLLWGLVAGWFGAAAIVIGPFALMALSDQGSGDLAAVGGVGRYILWAFGAGTLIGLTMGLTRLQSRTSLGVRVGAGLVVTQFFSTQFIVLGPGEALDMPLGVAAPMLAFCFFGGFVVGPSAAKGLYASFPELHDWGAPDHELMRRQDEAQPGSG